jgi:hypothetical protein
MIKWLRCLILGHNWELLSIIFVDQYGIENKYANTTTQFLWVCPRCDKLREKKLKSPYYSCRESKNIKLLTKQDAKNQDPN